MRDADALAYALRALGTARVRTVLVVLAMGIGVASVVALTALGESARRYVRGEFESLGTHLLIVLPGRSETVGGPPPLLGETPRDLTVEDARALLASPAVRRVAPVAVGAAPVSWQGREREVTVLGTTAEFLTVRRLRMARGRFLPRWSGSREDPVCVLGAKVRRELFGPAPALGEKVRIGQWRFRVIGVLAEEGRSLGVDIDDMVVIPVRTAQALFDSPSLFRILVEARSEADVEPAKKAVLRIIRARHDGEEDVTVITQDAVLATFDRILGALTWALGGIASVSLLVAGILIMNIMLVAVSQRTPEVGVLKAVGASRAMVLRLFLVEAVLASAIGSAVGLALGELAALVLRWLYPVLPVHAPVWALGAAGLLALGAGLVFGVLPARRAARLDPVAALQRR